LQLGTLIACRQPDFHRLTCVCIRHLGGRAHSQGGWAGIRGRQTARPKPSQRNDERDERDNLRLHLHNLTTQDCSTNCVARAIPLLPRKTLICAKVCCIRVHSRNSRSSLGCDARWAFLLRDSLSFFVTHNSWPSSCSSIILRTSGIGAAPNERNVSWKRLSVNALPCSRR